MLIRAPSSESPPGSLPAPHRSVGSLSLILLIPLNLTLQDWACSSTVWYLPVRRRSWGWKKKKGRTHQRQVIISKDLDVTKNRFSSEPQGPLSPAPQSVVFHHPCLSWRPVCSHQVKPCTVSLGLDLVPSRSQTISYLAPLSSCCLLCLLHLEMISDRSTVALSGDCDRFFFYSFWHLLNHFALCVISPLF